jgi:hypothetical protein
MRSPLFHSIWTKCASEKIVTAVHEVTQTFRGLPLCSLLIGRKHFVVLDSNYRSTMFRITTPNRLCQLIYTNFHTTHRRNTVDSNFYGLLFSVSSTLRLVLQLLTVRTRKLTRISTTTRKKNMHYYLLLNIMHLTCTAWVESYNTREDSRRKKYRSCQKHESPSLREVGF